MSSYKRNIKLVYWLSGLAWARFYIPVIALFYIAHNISLDQFAIIMGVYALATFLLEIPMGVVSDLLGRKNTLILSDLTLLIEVLIMTFSQGFVPFLIAKIISAVGTSLSSGTFQGFVYESLLKQRKQKQYKKVMGTSEFIVNIARSIAFISGGFLFSIHYKLPIYLTVPFVIISVIMNFYLKETNSTKQVMTIKKSLNHFTSSFKQFFNNKKLISLTLYSLPLFGALYVILNSSSAYFEAIAAPLFIIGVIQFISALASALSSKQTHKIDKYLGEHKTLLLSYGLITLGTLSMIFMIPLWGVITYMFIPLGFGLLVVISGAIANKDLSSKNRVTLLSIKNMFVSLTQFIVFPLIGAVYVFNFSLGNAFLFLFLLLGFLVAQGYTTVHKVKL